MALTDSILNMLNKKPKDSDTPDPTRSVREAKLKDKAGMVISVFALILAVNAWYGNRLSGTTLNNTIAANDVWSFYEAKSIKQMLAEQSLDDAIIRKDVEKIAKLEAKIARYESEPATGEGKKEILAKARVLEADRESAKKRSQFFGMAATTIQIAIIFSTTAILAVSMALWYASIGVGIIGLIILADGIWYFFPLPF